MTWSLTRTHGHSAGKNIGNRLSETCLGANRTAKTSAGVKKETSVLRQKPGIRLQGLAPSKPVLSRTRVAMLTHTFFLTYLSMEQLLVLWCFSEIKSSRFPARSGNDRPECLSTRALVLPSQLARLSNRELRAAQLGPIRRETLPALCWPIP